MFRKLRILLMLFLLFLIGGDALLTKWRSTDWDAPLAIAVFVINGDNSEKSAQYIKQLTETNFAEVETYLAEEAKQYELPLAQPAKVFNITPLLERPPAPPQDRNPLNVMWWSLKLRYWVWQVKREHGPPADVQMFVLYHDPEKNPRLAHSLGLEKGLIGVVNAYASRNYTSKNNVVIAHEFLHTVGATDKYDLATGHPLYPQGYFEPDRDPLHPQEFAEIMAGATPLTETTHKMPDYLAETVIGVETAREINWIN